jgi:hypothetical protein
MVTFTLYEARGNYQICVQRVLVEGGAASRRYQQLKLRLESEGLFDPGRKRQIPTFPNVSRLSPRQKPGDHDVLHRFSTQYPFVQVIEVGVGAGPAAADEMSMALDIVNRLTDADVIPWSGGAHLRSYRHLTRSDWLELYLLHGFPSSRVLAMKGIIRLWILWPTSGRRRLRWPLRLPFLMWPRWFCKAARFKDRSRNHGPKDHGESEAMAAGKPGAVAFESRAEAQGPESRSRQQQAALHEL